MVMTNLDSEVKELSSSTVDTMKQCMAKVNALKYKMSLYCTGYMGWPVLIYTLNYIHKVVWCFTENLFCVVGDDRIHTSWFAGGG